MCFRTSGFGLPALLLALALVASMPVSLGAEPSASAGSRNTPAAAAAAASADAPSGDRIRRAAAETRADLERPVPRQRESSTRAREPDRLPAMTGLEEALRIVVWVLGAVVVLYVAVRLRSWIRMRAPAARPRIEPPVPARVSGLDIRPASMPDDVAAQAARLWRDGQGRAALALLYRAALSRLVHAHAVPIRAASTEQECVSLSKRALPPGSAAFFASLVEAWLLAAYGAHLPDEPRMLALCEGFERLLPAQRQAS